MIPSLLHTVTSQFAQASVNCGGGATCNTGLPTISASSGNIQTLLQIVFGVIGAVALIIIIIAGLQFVTSLGNPESVKKARMTIIYAAVGLAVSLLAEAIVTFVLGKL